MSAQQPTPQFTDDDIFGTDSEVTDEEQTEKEGTKVQTASHPQTRVRATVQQKMQPLKHYEENRDDSKGSYRLVHHKTWIENLKRSTVASWLS